MSWLKVPEGVVCVDDEVRCIYIVAFEDHLEYLWLMDSTLLHEIDDLVLDSDCMVDIVIKLNLNFILKLTGFCEEIFIFYWISKVLVIFCQEIELTDMCPRIVSISHRIHGPNSYIFTSS